MHNFPKKLIDQTNIFCESRELNKLPSHRGLDNMPVAQVEASNISASHNPGGDSATTRGS